jgi:signal transduction histidine kinase
MSSMVVPRGGSARVSRRLLVDATWALVVLGVGITEVLGGDVSGPRWAALGTVFACGLPLLVRRRYPWSVLLVVFGAMVASYLVGVDQYNFLAEVIAGVVAGYTFAESVPVQQAVLGFAYAYVATGYSSLRGDGSLMWGVVVLGGAWLAGGLMRERRLLVERLRRATEELSASREEYAALAVAEERTRLARDMHDVVAHSVSVMVVQAAVAERLADADPRRARAALTAVQCSGSEALGELRRMLSVLCPPSDTSADLAPQPGLANLPALTEQLHAAGVAVSLRVEGDERPLPPGVGLAGYRIVQEALTNALRHSGAQSADVVITYGSDTVGLMVCNPLPNGLPQTSDGPHTPGGGHGLAGMRERAAAYAGTLTSGPTPDGYQVRATLAVSRGTTP